LKIFAQKIAFFEKTTRYGDISQYFVAKRIIVTQILALCVNFVEFGRPEISKVARYLPPKKQNIASLALASARIAPKIRQHQRQTM